MKLLFISIFISILSMLPLSASVARDTQSSARTQQPPALVPPVRPARPAAFVAKRQPPQVQNSANPLFNLVGMASFYGKKFHGQYTASGERFDKDEFTAAHPSLPFGTRVKVTNLRNRRSVVVKVNDRGAFKKHGRIIDVSRAAASELGMVRRGVAKVKLEIMQ